MDNEQLDEIIKCLNEAMLRAKSVEYDSRKISVPRQGT